MELIGTSTLINSDFKRVIWFLLNLIEREFGGRGRIFLHLLSTVFSGLQR
jgi:hypothetical protein